MTSQPELLHQLRELLGRAESEPHTIALLTDEELVALEHADASTPYPTPWLTRDPRRREAAAQFGVRSLLTRGLIRATDPRPDAPSTLDVPPDIRIALDTRRVGLGYICAMQPRDDVAVSKICVVQPELGSVEEEITIEGFHLFTACNYTDSAGRLARWCLPSHDGSVVGGTMVISEQEWPKFLYEELPDATVTDLVIEIYLPDADGNRSAERWMLAYGQATAMLAERAGGERLVIRAVTTHRLSDLIGDRIHGALQYARTGGG